MTQPSEESLKRAFEMLHKQLGHAPNMALGPLLQDIALAIDEAKREEREACAVVCEEFEPTKPHEQRFDDGWVDVTKWGVARAIRERGNG